MKCLACLAVCLAILGSGASAAGPRPRSSWDEIKKLCTESEKDFTGVFERLIRE